MTWGRARTTDPWGPWPMDDLSRLPTWRQMNRDTTPEAEAVLVRLWRETPAWRKWELMEDLNRAARELALAGLRRRHPDAGPELAAEVYGPLDE